MPPPPARLLAPAGMIEVVDRLRHGGADTGGTLQVFQCRRTHFARRPEMQQQRPLALQGVHISGQGLSGGGVGSRGAGG